MTKCYFGQQYDQLVSTLSTNLEQSNKLKYPCYTEDKACYADINCTVRLDIFQRCIQIEVSLGEY
jgi:hypothetical protein